MENDVLVIGIAGGTASGKTTLMKNLIGEFGAEVTVLSHDNYYKRHDEMPFEERCKLNYDEPAAFDTSLMVYHLDQLRHGQAIECPVYDFTVHNRSGETIRLVPKKVIIVEGILIFENEDLRNLMDIKIFVDTDADIRLCRRIKRDVNNGGARWKACWSSTKPPSSPCTSAMWSQASDTPTWSFPRAARIWWR